MAAPSGAVSTPPIYAQRQAVESFMANLGDASGSVQLDGLLDALAHGSATAQVAGARLRAFFEADGFVPTVTSSDVLRALTAEVQAPAVEFPKTTPRQRPELLENHEITKSPLTVFSRSRTVQGWLSKEGDPDRIFAPPSEGEDRFLSDLAREIGFAGAPHVVSAEALESFAALGEQKLMRGVTDTSFVDQLRSGAYFAGSGSCGNGIYVALASRADLAAHHAGSTGSVAEMTLKRGAKVANDVELNAEMDRLGAEHRDQTAKQVKLLGLKGQPERAAAYERERVAEELMFFTDPGRFAMLKGFDAIHVTGRNILVVLNRTALRVTED
jgi:hypothetical protein